LRKPALQHNPSRLSFRPLLGGLANGLLPFAASIGQFAFRFSEIFSKLPLSPNVFFLLHFGQRALDASPIAFNLFATGATLAIPAAYGLQHLVVRCRIGLAGIAIDAGHLGLDIHIRVE
jgi:hypothetical protein